MMRMATAALMMFALGSVAQQASIPRQVTISFTSPARAGLPIWMTVNTPEPQNVRYPVSWIATEFGCVEIQVRRGERLIPAVELKGIGPGSAGGVCGAMGMTPGRLPFHLHYPKLEPGKYEVRFKRFYPDFRTHNNTIVEQSDWTELKVDEATTKEVETWLSDLLANVPDSPVQLLGDFLPSLLASRSERSLAAVMDQIYSRNDNVAHYASYSLYLFDIDLVRKSLLRTIHERGPTYALAEALPPIGDRFANILALESARFLDANDPEKLSGAMHMVLMISFFKVEEQTRQALSRAEQASVGHVLEQRNERAAQDLVQFLAQLKTPEAHDQIWRFVDAHLAEEQALICVTWVQDPADLPKLAAILSTYDAADPNGSRRASVFYGMKRYGGAAQPYFRRILSESRQAFVRTSAAQELVLLNDQAGWEFFRAMMDERPFYYNEMVRWLKETFSEIRNGDEKSIAGFLDRKISVAR